VPEHIVSDPRKLRQVLLSLVGNAIKFTKQGAVEVVLRAAEHQGHLFDPFWQSDGSLTRTAGGTGLGLAITRHLRQLLEGTVTVESRPDAGSVFRVRLPEALEPRGAANLIQE
jgi:signal transduction histidine kinase